MSKLPAPAVLIAGTNPTPIWGMSSEERLHRIARARGLPTTRGEPDGPVLIAAASHVFDHQWIGFMLARPGSVLTSGDVPVLAHLTGNRSADLIRKAMAEGHPLPEGLPVEIVRAEDHRVFYNEALRKREEPMLEPLTPGNVRAIERMSYFGAYKGVTDILTKYLWPEWALVLTRIAARIGLTPNMITTIGAIFCVVATVLFAYGHYWLGMAAGLFFMVLDTVDGKLARCTITSSAWGNVFDHGMDLVHPPFWWWFWATGLVHWGLALDSTTFWWVQGVIQIGYWVQRAIEGIFMHRNAGMHIHVWQKIDSDFRLITARRNPNMVILFVATAFQRPDIGLIAVAVWTGLSCLFHLVRLIQAEVRRAKGDAITSWLAA
ncbi:CDP-alcohol phosphatidyltransferase family protein [Sphingomonas crocodyli]|uniref:CDP-alcohol phosphatidyltransferase family protein n=1 Tax=Sphingomonas crocodyli TaxID=1979270 RepID=A0A437MA74_9SPHN|nr:CDP-alcohol phosphatidyltransferase family protein [Sphingomonas crocodyli]RVT94539.1 CDP-alcohol phosphatidyltransferase family protein [Sphingomonas crocodyli]